MYFGECLYVVIFKNENQLHYVTYEKTRDTTRSGFVGIVGSWSLKGSQSKHGSRKYRDPEIFISDALKSSARVTR